MPTNGDLPRKDLRRIYHPSYEVYLEKNAAAAFNTLRIWSKRWMKVDLYPTGEMSAYRTRSQQEYLYSLYLNGTGALAAVPGTSNHGWGKAIDLPTYAMQQIIKRFGKKVGWDKIEAPSEPWHYNYVGPYNKPNPGLSVKYPIARLGSGGWGQKWFVKKLERRLKKLGYKSVVVDGAFGRVTEEKVKNFQKLTGLKKDGVVGKQTWIKLYQVNKKELDRLRKKKQVIKPIEKPNQPKEMTTSNEGVDFIKSWEGFSPKPVNIGDGVATLGFGHTQPLSSNRDIWVKGQKKRGELTLAEGKKLLASDLKRDYEPAVRKLFEKGGALEGLFTQELFDALVSFAYNLGIGAFTAPSGFETIQRNIRNRDVKAIAECLQMYRSPGTIFEQGLLRRRLAERDIILKKKYQNNR